MQPFFLLLVVLALSGCTSPSMLPHTQAVATPAPATHTSDDLQHVLTAAIEFLLTQQDPTTGLLVESTVVATDTRWIATDNRLAVLAFAAAGHAPPPGLLEALEPYAAKRHGVIEVLDSGFLDTPIRTAITITVTETPLIKLEQRTDKVMDDWEEYADLLLYAALDAFNRDEPEVALGHYDTALALFDGAGFADKAFEADGVYATYKNALAIIVGQRLEQPRQDDILTALLASQEASGGFVTRYDPVRPTDDDANTETTALAILALAALSD